MATEKIQELADEYGIPTEVVEEYIEYMGFDADEVDELNYYGTFKNESDFAEQLVDEGVITDLGRYLYMTSTDMRILAGEEADNRVDNMDDEEVLDETGDNYSPDEVDEAREYLKSEYYDEIHEELEKDAVGYFVDQFGYREEDLAKQSIFSVDYDKLGEDLEYDFNYITHDGDVYVFNNYKRGGETMAKGGNVPTIEKRVAEVNALIKEGNEKGVEVIDESTTWEAPMKYNLLKYTNGVLYVSFEKLDLYKYNKGRGTEWNKESYKIGKNEMGMSMFKGNAQTEALTEIARMYRKAINSFNKYGYADGGMMAKGGGIRYKIYQDEKGYYEKGFYGVFDIKRNLILELFQFKKEAEAYLNEVKEKGLNVDSSKYNGQLKNYMADGGEISIGSEIVGSKKMYFIYNSDSGKKSVYYDSKEKAEQELKSMKDKMSDGGVTFDDKVNAISRSLMERKKVSPSVQKDYGKTYSRKEAIDSAKRIAGAMRKKKA